MTARRTPACDITDGRLTPAHDVGAVFRSRAAVACAAPAVGGVDDPARPPRGFPGRQGVPPTDEAGR
ncbi:hypothetical protein PNP85_11885 [Halobacterium salinarum]|uniref:Uncharacterized protein n=2 Tax=Halobacterium salinarum TaxID=2242 RepID=A0A510N705_HALSA|nr:hypothetical protein [Halobacterium salinarum]MCF2165261.1 hypothetical protein [Halobacterium salinarum]MCF2167930.1 hypothetical protein [Halobacterium salinarum]MCF2242174.1 hypothetical protein [Halobacterium salinarum]MDL0118839.1 hypothetical protein [Halobacterium salinarum]MDL0127684.1 hypothetical protein [Halobacterium salinarum]